MQKLYYNVSCRPHAMVCYPLYPRRDSKSWRSPKLFKPTQDISPGTLSRNARIKIQKALRWLSECSDVKQTFEKSHGGVIPWKVNMITLTFHENMKDDRLARKLLSMWLEMAKYRFQVTEYVWKAEPQERGAIHFHLCTNVYVPHAELKYTWNRLLRKHNLNNITDNSTDVHAVTEAKNLLAYLTDYMTNEAKHEGRRQIKGKLWGCSHGLSQAGKESLTIDEDELKSWDQELVNFSLANRIWREGKEVPGWLSYVRLWMVPPGYYDKLPDCDLKRMFNLEISKLRVKARLKDLFYVDEKPVAAAQPSGGFAPSGLNPIPGIIVNNPLLITFPEPTQKNPFSPRTASPWLPSLSLSE